MLDAAHLQEEEARHHARRANSASNAVPEPLYTVLDALNAQDHFGRKAVYGQALDIAPGLRATFLDAGHILGSASICLELVEHGRRCSVAFSGDLGNAGRPLLRDPVVPPKVDAVVMETTYGDRLHKNAEDTAAELAEARTSEVPKVGGNEPPGRTQIMPVIDVPDPMPAGAGAARWPRGRSSVSYGQTAQKGTRTAKDSLRHTIRSPSRSSN